MQRKLTSAILKKLTQKYGDSFYLLDSERFESNYTELIKAFEKYYSKCNIAYSYKTNYTPKLVKIVNRLGGYAEIVSDMELDIALHSGVEVNRIIWNGPIKNDARVKDFLLLGGTVNIDSVFEMNTICDLAKENPDNILSVGVRCNYDVGDGVLSRFGIDSDSEEFDRILGIISDTANIKLKGIQAHFAKRSPEYWTVRTEKILSIYERIVNEYGMKPEIIDLGGGIYGKMPESLRIQLGVQETTYDDYASKAALIFANHFKNQLDSPWLLIEPGTAIAGDSMRFVCRIMTIKKIRGKGYATVLGSQKNISMSNMNPPLEVFDGGGKREWMENIDIVGFTCIEGDVLQKNFTGEIGIGDYIVIENCGSYSLVMKPPFILPNFPVLDICGDSVEVIKKAETFDDLFCTYCF